MNRIHLHLTGDARRAAATVILCLAVLATGARAQSTARTWALAGATTAASRGLEAVSTNPANLAFSPGTTISLVGAAASLANNAISLDLYNEITGATLDEADKQRVLDAIGSGGLNLNGDAEAAGLGLHTGGFALSVQGLAAGRGNLDRDVFDLVLFGNELGETVDFDDTWGEVAAYGAATVSFGTVFASDAGGRWAAGVSVRYLHGLYEAHVEEARGSLTTTTQAVSGDAVMSLVSSDRGSGYSADLGVSWQRGGGWTFGLAYRNPLSHLSWTGNAERHVYAVSATELSAGSDTVDDAFATTDTTYAIDGYSTRLPRQFRLGACRDTGRLMLAADYIQGLDNAGSVSEDPELALGAEWRPLGWLLPRAGLSLGGLHGASLAGGLGLRLGLCHLDFMVASRGSVQTGGGTKGLAGGFSLQLVF